MSGSRSKKSGGYYDSPKAGGAAASAGVGASQPQPNKRTPEDVPLGTGMANQAKEDLKEIRNKRFPDPNDY